LVEDKSEIEGTDKTSQKQEALSWDRVEATVLISDTKMPNNPMRCPSCQSTTFILEGAYRRGFRQVFIDGKPDKEDISPDPFIDILSLHCPKCKIKYFIIDDMTYAIYEENRRLQAESEAISRAILTEVQEKRKC
jgi:hypothetical protein